MTVRRWKSQGFTLIEVMIASVVALVFVSLVVGVLVSTMRRLDASKLELLEAQELAQIANAANTYIGNNKLNWALSARTETTLPTLITAGHLPAGFGARHGSATSRTPYGNTYRIFSIVDATRSSIVRTIITESGSVVASAMDKAGIANNNAEIRSLKERIAQEVTESAKWYTATVPEASTTAAGALGSFTQVLATHFGANTTQPVVVVFVGWPEYDPNGGGTTTESNPLELYQYCDVRDGVTTNNASCPVGQVEIFQWPVCDGSTGRVYPTAAGPITVGSEYVGARFNSLEFGTCLFRNVESRNPRCRDASDPTAAFNYEVMIPYTMNNATVVTTTCRTGTYREFPPPGYIGTIWPHIQTPTYAASYRHRVCCLPK